MTTFFSTFFAPFAAPFTAPFTACATPVSTFFTAFSGLHARSATSWEHNAHHCHYDPNLRESTSAESSLPTLREIQHATRSARPREVHMDCCELNLLGTATKWTLGATILFWLNSEEAPRRSRAHLRRASPSLFVIPAVSFASLQMRVWKRP